MPRPELETRLRRRFPALERLGRRLGLRRVPVVQQVSATECGAAALAMVLAYFGRVVRIDELREAAGVARDGTNALALIQVANAYGLRGRGIKLQLDDLKHLSPAAILHWEFSHFVVFERLTADGGADIVDPAHGRRRVSRAELSRAFTGVALVFEPTEEFVPGKSGTNHFWRYAKKALATDGLLGRIVVTSLLLELLGLGGPMMMSQVADKVIPRGEGQLLLVLAAAALTVGSFQTLATYVRAHLFIHLRTLLSVRMSLGFLEHLVRLPYSFFQLRSAGDLMMRLNSNDAVRDMLTGSALSTVIDGALVFVYLAVLFYISAGFAVLILAIATLQITVFAIGRRCQRALVNEGLHKQARSQSYEVELFTGIETLKAMGCEDRGVQRWSDLFVDVANNGLQQSRLSAALEAVGVILGLASSLGPLLFGTHLILAGKLTMGTMLMSNSLGGALLGQLSRLTGVLLQLQLLGAYVERINDVLDTPPEQPEPRRMPPRLRGRISLREVSFRYGAQSPPVIDGVSIDIEPGQFVAIVGRSGAGKSTLASLMLGLYAPTSGAVLFDGMNLGELDLRSVRRQLGIVTQSHEMFGSSIRENIALAEPSTALEQVIAAAKLAQIHDDISAMPLGYETPLTDRGASLSGGQRQRLALARALVRRPAILLLDEATSALDAETERRVQRAVASLRCTRVVIAHRLSTVVHADVILVLDQGRIVEVGAHRDLVRHGGLYASLVAAHAA